MMQQKHIITRQLQRQRGQAMTEFTVTAMFLLIPIFLLIPMLGKYIDIRHSAVQTARSMAWERTAWFEQDNWPTDAGTAQFKTRKQIEQAVALRELSNAQRPFSGGDWNTPLAQNDLNTLWTDHAGDPLLTASTAQQQIKQYDQKRTSQLAYSYFVLDGLQEVENGINKAIDKGENAMHSAAGVLGISLPSVGDIDIFSKFNAQAYYQPGVRIPLNNIASLDSFGGQSSPFNDLDLVIHGDAALLTDGWSAKNEQQFAQGVGDFMPSHYLRPVFNPIQRAINSINVLGIGLAPRTAPDILRFGEVVISPIPDSSVEPDCPGGICSYE